jgi:hypothetical protein
LVAVAYRFPILAYNFLTSQNDIYIYTHTHTHTHTLQKTVCSLALGIQGGRSNCTSWIRKEKTEQFSQDPNKEMIVSTTEHD